MDGRNSADIVTPARLWAWIAITKDGNYTVRVGHFDRDLGVELPLVSFREEIVQLEREAAVHHRRLTGERVLLVRFADLEVIEELP